MGLFSRQQAAKPSKELAVFLGQPQTFSEQFQSAFGGWHPDALIRDKGIDTYEKMMNDPVCKAAVDQLGVSVLSGDAEVQPAEDGSPDTAQWIGAALEQMPGSLAQTLGALVKDAVAYGWALSEIIWKRTDEGWIVDRIDRRDPYWFTWKREAGNKPWVLHRYTDEYKRKSEPIETDDKFVVFSYNANMSNPFGESELRAAYFPWFSKCKIVPWWADHLQKTASTIWRMKVPSGLDNNTMSGLKGMLANLFRKQYATVPQEVDLEAMDTHTVSGSQSFEMALDFLNKEMARAILSQTLTVMEGSYGSNSFALGNVHESLLGRKASAIRRQLEEVFTEQVIRPMVEFNFGPAEPVPQLQIPEPAVANLQIYAQAIATLEAAGIVDGSEPWVREKAGLPPADPALMLARPGRVTPSTAPIEEEEVEAEVAQV